MNPHQVAVEFDQALLDPEAVKIIRRLKRFGHEAYLVGGCVRDLLLGENPKDFDVATSAKPEEIRKLFRNCRIIGRRFRLAHIFFPGQKIIEVATFRSQAPVAEPEEPPVEEGPSGDMAPAPKDLLILQDNVFGTAESDALRRDFTINALFYEVESKTILDYVGGLNHLKDKRLVSIGDPWIRLREDPVRIIRAAKFAAKLGLELDAQIARAMVDCHADIQKSSPARVIEEIFKVLSGRGCADTFVKLQEIGLLPYVFPILAEDAKRDPEWRLLRALERGLSGDNPDAAIPKPLDGLASPSRAIRFAALFGPLFLADFCNLKDTTSAHELRHRISARVRDLGIMIRNPRKDTYRVQQIFLAQERLWKGAFPQINHDRPKRFRRLVPAKVIASKPFFAEALQWMWICGRADSDLFPWEAYSSWLPLLQQVAAHPSSTHPQGMGRRRRNRRSRRRRRFQQGQPRQF